METFTELWNKAADSLQNLVHDLQEKFTKHEAAATTRMDKLQKQIDERSAEGGLVLDGPHLRKDPVTGEDINETRLPQLEFTKEQRPKHGPGVFLHKLWGRLWVFHSILVSGGGNHVHGLIVRNEPNLAEWPEFAGMTHGSIYLNTEGVDGVRRYYRLEYICTGKVPDVIHPPLNSSDRTLVQYIQIDLIATSKADKDAEETGAAAAVLEHEKCEGHDACAALLLKWAK